MENQQDLQETAGTHKYDDIIETVYPLEQHDRIHHPPMPIADRAKIFSPFAALRGHREAIHNKDINVKKL